MIMSEELALMLRAYIFLSLDEPGFRLQDLEVVAVSQRIARRERDGLLESTRVRTCFQVQHKTPDMSTPTSYHWLLRLAKTS